MENNVFVVSDGKGRNVMIVARDKTDASRKAKYRYHIENGIVNQLPLKKEKEKV